MQVFIIAVFPGLFHGAIFIPQLTCGAKHSANRWIFKTRFKESTVRCYYSEDILMLQSYVCGAVTT
jgi:hypothetical protein